MDKCRDIYLFIYLFIGKPIKLKIQISLEFYELANTSELPELKSRKTNRYAQKFKCYHTEIDF